MIRTIIGVSFLRLWHNRAELLLTFIVPICFFSIFAWIFGSRASNGSTPQLKVVACDLVGDDLSKRTVALLRESPSLQFHEIDASDPSQSVSLRVGEGLVRRGIVSAAIVIKSSDTDKTAIDVVADSFDQVASQVVVALTQKASMTARGDLINAKQAAMIASSGRTELSASQPSPFDSSAQFATKSPSDGEVVAANFNSASAALELVDRVMPLGIQSQLAAPTISVIDVLGKNKANPIVAMYAAGIAVMFLLFSATTASGTILEERENSTLERLLCSRMTMDHLLMGKWCYLVLIGVLQTTLMFVAGALFFRLNLIEHLDGFMIMTFVTAGAAASFALMMATMCKTRVQLGWISTILILSMSALGGSMVPRYLMSENIQRVGQFTFNAWALDGYNKIFWRELPLTELWLELAVLITCGFVFMVLARIFASRWDCA